MNRLQYVSFRFFKHKNFGNKSMHIGAINMGKEMELEYLCHC